MAKLEFKKISHSYELSKNPKLDKSKAKWAVKDMNLIWEDGTANALLGPSGCGKTTILNILSGLLKPTQGQIFIGNRDVTNIETRDGHIAQVFQFPVVYDSMDVYNNLAFPLINKNVPDNEIDKKVKEVAEILNLTDYLRSSSSALNSAEKQKISLGRGIIREDTEAILLDEPLTVIDPKMRGELRRSLKQVQQELKITMIYVTHDQHEALTFAEYVTIVKDGKFVQKGTPNELYSQPSSPFVGYFIGSPGMNVIECKLQEKKLQCSGFNIKISDKILKNYINKNQDSLRIGIRPEELEVSVEKKENGIKSKVAIVEDVGNYKILTLSLGKIRIKARVNSKIDVKEEEYIFINFPEKYIKIFSNDERIY